MTDYIFLFTFGVGVILGLAVSWISHYGRILDYQEQISNLRSIILNKKK